MRKLLLLLTLLVLGCASRPPDENVSTKSSALFASRDFSLFESDQVRPLALSPDGLLLFAVNTPDNQLEIFKVKSDGLAHWRSLPVGLEPVAVSARSSTEVWVVNQLSDSVSVVLLDGYLRVERTLLVGDEPRDVVFAGVNKSRAFVTAAHRGQNSPVDPALSTPGVGRADVWVFDADNLGASLGGDPLAIVNLFADKPRALAASPDGSRVYAAGYMTGNQTTVINALQAFFTYPPPATNHEGVPHAPNSLIVGWDGQHWVDELGTVYDDSVRLSLPDKDVFVIDALASPPAALPEPAGVFRGVGTVLFNMAVNPVSGRVYVSNTDGKNRQRFEGPGIFAGHSLRGHLHESQITVLEGVSASPRHLNKHVDYSECCAPVPNDESERSLAFPQMMAVSSDGSTLYVAALGSSKLGVFSTAELEADTFVPSSASHVELTGGGPTGVVLDEQRGRLYALTRFNNSVAIVDAAAKQQVGEVTMHNPEPASVVEGRRFHYDARNTSSHGDSACASCHVFGDFDAISWDLSNPDGDVVANANPFTGSSVLPPTFHPMKGPMSTQSLRGMSNHGPMHFRGDRTGSLEEPSAQPDEGAFDEVAAFMKFRPAFDSLLGRSESITEDEMLRFTTFALQIMYPPNPIRRLDNELTVEQQLGRDAFFVVEQSPDRLTCEGCHRIDPEANAGVTQFPGFFGTDGTMSFSNQPDNFKTPHLRNMYQKVGMFGLAFHPGFFPENLGHQGDQIRGFGFGHSGEADSLFRFVTAAGFDQTPQNPNGLPHNPEGDAVRMQMVDFMFAFDTNHAPIVGQQITLSADQSASGARATLLEQRADAGECDLIVKTSKRGYLYLGGGLFESDRASDAPVTGAKIRERAAAEPHTFTCAPLGEGRRRGVDRDGDGVLDEDERLAGTDPASAMSRP